MKKYYYEASKKLLDRSTEPLYVHCTTAKCWVIAESEAEAEKLACAKLHAKYDCTGTVLGKLTLTKSAELPIDWSYGYGDERKSGDTAALGDLVGNNVIR